jgi:hypothetical protein
VSCGIFIDLRGGLKIRRWRGNTIALPLETKQWILARVREAGAGYGVDRRQQEELSRLRGSDGLWKTWRNY